MKKNNIGLVIVVLALILTILVVMFVLPNFNRKSNVNTANKNENENSEVIETFTKEEAEKLLDKFGFNLKINCDSTVLDYEYDETFKGIVALKNVPNIQYSTASCSELFTEPLPYEDNFLKGETGVCSKNESLQLISYSDANDSYKNLYNEEMPKHSYSGKNNFYVFYDYVPAKDSFASMKCHGCGGSCGTTLKVFEVLDTHFNNTQLVIDVANYYDHNFTLTEGAYHLATNHTDESISCTSADDCQNTIKNNYLDKLNLYSIQFEKMNDNFILKTITQK